MRVITWNCNGAFRRKIHSLDKFDADLIVIQECEDPARSTRAFADWAGKKYLWKGTDKNKGIGIFPRNGNAVQPLDWEDSPLELFLPFTVNRRLNVLAVWTKPGGSYKFQYIGQFWKYLQRHKESLRHDPTIICGDFNSNKRWDTEGRSWNHSNCVIELEEIGIFSIYHRFFGEEQGEESKPTLFMHRKVDRPYHVDYVFVSERILEKSTVVVGSSAYWLELSDHMPIVATLKM